MQIFVIASLLFSCAVLTRGETPSIDGIYLVKAGGVPQGTSYVVAELGTDTIVAVEGGTKPRFSIEALVPEGFEDTNVQFDFGTTINFKNETGAPFGMCGYRGKVFIRCPELVVSDEPYTVTATPLGGEPYTVTFRILGVKKAFNALQRKYLDLEVAKEDLESKVTEMNSKCEGTPETDKPESDEPETDEPETDEPETR
jgi:hypothetical protein